MLTITGTGTAGPYPFNYEELCTCLNRVLVTILLNTYGCLDPVLSGNTVPRHALAGLKRLAPVQAEACTGQR